MATALALARLARTTPRFRLLSTSLYNGAESGVKHWKYERLVSVVLVGLIPAGFIYPNAVVDYGLALALPLHGHWGFGSIIEDYVSQPLRKLAYPLLGIVSIGTFLGLVYLNFYDVGICKAVQMLWALK